jgi:hypothetical protein
MSSRGTKRKPRSEVSRPTGQLAVAQALSHPLRIRILTAMQNPPRAYSPNGFAEETGLDLTRVSYHFRELRELGCIEEVDQRTRRGAIEHFYRPKKRAAAWQTQWEDLPPITKQNLAATALRCAVEAVGASVDSGAFEARDDAVIAHHTFRVDERGASDTMQILTRAVEELLAVSEQSEARLQKAADDGFLISYVAAGFEGAIRPA